jgi:putative toxin-antitoxin system antitoxin component (TIGR02293 family)
METQTSDITKDGEQFIRTQKMSRNAYVVLLGLNVFDVTGLVRVVQKGLPWKAFARFVRNSALSAEQVADLIGVPRRTLARRKADGRFMPVESDRLLRAARVFSGALDLYDGNREAARDFFVAPNWAFGGISPFELARTDIGAMEVENLYGQIAHGIFS